MIQKLPAVKLAIGQTTIELKRHYTIFRIISTLIAPIAIFILIKLGLPDWMGGKDLFRWILAAYLAVALSITGLITLSAGIIGDQEDGTLLRAKTLPAGLHAHLIAKVAFLTLNSLISIVLILISTYLASNGELLNISIRLFGLFPLIILAVSVTAPMGLIAGGISRKISAVIYITLFGYFLVAISGIFFSPDFMPLWLTYVARVFPIYWLGYLSRQILLEPHLLVDQLTAFEWSLGGGILLGWLIFGILYVPVAIRALSRRQSGRRLEKSNSPKT